MGLIVVAAGLGLLLGLGQSEERRFERAAASEISSKLGGDEKKVRVNVRPHGVGALQGDLTVAQIFAERFTLDELPLFTEPERNPSGRIRSLQLRLTEFAIVAMQLLNFIDDDEIGILHNLGSRWGVCHEIVGILDGHCSLVWQWGM